MEPSSSTSRAPSIISVRDEMMKKLASEIETLADQVAQNIFEKLEKDVSALATLDYALPTRDKPRQLEFSFASYETACPELIQALEKNSCAIHAWFCRQNQSKSSHSECSTIHEPNHEEWNRQLIALRDRVKSLVEQKASCYFALPEYSFIFTTEDLISNTAQMPTTSIKLQITYSISKNVSVNKTEQPLNPIQETEEPSILLTIFKLFIFDWMTRVS